MKIVGDEVPVVAGPPADPVPAALLDAFDALLGEVVRRVEDAGPELRQAFTMALVAAAPQRFCGLVDQSVQASCDRPPRHEGDCSWEVDRIRRRYREFEEQAALAPVLANQRDGALARARRAEARLGTLISPEVTSADAHAALGELRRQRARPRPSPPDDAGGGPSPP